MWHLLFLLAVFLFFLIPKDTEEELDDEEDFIEEFLLFWDYEEEDEY